RTAGMGWPCGRPYRPSLAATVTGTVAPVRHDGVVAQRKTEYVCTECGTAHPKWGGQCSGCRAWNTLVEEVVGAAIVPAMGLAPASPPLPIDAVDPLGATPQATGIGELDRVLGGGLVPGSVTLLGGE